MVSSNLHSASRTLGDSVTELRFGDLFWGSAGLGGGLVGAEMIGDRARERAADRRPLVQDGVDVGSRAALAGALGLASDVVDFGDDVETLLLLGAFSAASSAVFRAVEIVLDGELQASSAQNRKTVSSANRSTGASSSGSSSTRTRSSRAAARTVSATSGNSSPTTGGAI